MPQDQCTVASFLICFKQNAQIRNNFQAIHKMSEGAAPSLLHKFVQEFQKLLG